MSFAPILATASFSYKDYTISASTVNNQIIILDSENKIAYDGLISSVETALDIVDALKSGEPV